MQAEYADGRHRIRLGRFTHPVRGLLHGSAAAAVALLLPGLRAASDLPGHRLAFTVYGASLAVMFAVSALYHSVPWSPAWKRRWRRADHVMIYVFIAAATTPFAVVLVQGWLRPASLALVWGIAAVGIAQKVLDPEVGFGRSVTLQIVQGWSALVLVGPITAHLPAAGLAMLGTAGALYLTGAVLLLTRRPRLWPTLFSYHEVFHLLVVVASVLHLAVVTRHLAGA